MKKRDYGHFGKGLTGYAHYRTAFKRIYRGGKNNLLKANIRSSPPPYVPPEKWTLSDRIANFLAIFIIDFFIGAMICGAIVTISPDLDNSTFLSIFILILSVCTFHALFKSF